MKTKRLSILPLVIFIFYFTAEAQLQKESMTELFTVKGKSAPELIIPGTSFEVPVSFENNEYPVRRFLRVTGGIKMPGKFAPRGETLFREAEFLIDDNLDSVNTYRDVCSLYFGGNNEPFERHAYNRITGIDYDSSKLTLEIPCKRKSLKASGDGDFGVELQLYYKKPGRHPDEIYDAPDSIIYFSIPPGTGNFKIIKQDLYLPEKVAAILMRTGGTRFSGECWLEAPRIYKGKQEVFVSPFVQNENRPDNYNYWVGINMATRSHPKWKLEFAGKTIFNDYIFDRASDIADFYIKLPDNISGSGNLRLTLEKEAHRVAFPYELRTVQLIEESAGSFELISVPPFVAVGDTTALLIETNKPDITLRTASTGSGIRILDETLYCKNTGLHAIQFVATQPETDISFRISYDNHVKEGTIQQTVIKEKDNVYLSSGDEVHIDNEYEPYNYFFKWYIRHRLGNWYHFRPSYQWSGVRITDEKWVRHYTGLLNKMHIPYAWQVEGRTLAATRINPSLESLQSRMFRGKQAHENDGGYYYWQHFKYEGLHSDMAARTRPYGGIFAKHRPIYTDHGIFIHYDPYGVKDMADGSNKLVANLSYSRGESSRHTGPSTMFRYLYQAGYDWLGAEQMYGPEDIIMSALRGASRAYHKKEFGSLHAVQWGSKPFTDPKHALRFYNSLAVAYMHGSSHINTEEGLWTDEYSNDRFTQAGKAHMYAQHCMLDYIQTHARKGDLHTSIAVIQGRNDAWKSFGRTPAWSQESDKWKFNEAMESFDLLKVFYPENNVDYCSTDGLFTSTPYGPVDILPIEASEDVLQQYKALIFLGWNTFDNADFIRIKKFVEKGGVLLLSAAHLNSELQPDKVPLFPEDDTVIKTLLGTDYKLYKERTVIPLGKGHIIYYPENVYPANSGIRKSYAEDMGNIASDIVTGEYSKGWIKHAPGINFSVWDTDKLRTLYILNIDWKSNKPAQPAEFILADKVFEFDVPRYSIATIRCNGKVAGRMEGNTSDILEIKEEENYYMFVCQTTQADVLHVYDSGKESEVIIKIPSAGIHAINIEK